MAQISTEQIPLGIIIPELVEPYRTLLTEIVKGIERRTGSARYFVLKGESGADDLSDWAQAHASAALIALGWRSVEAAQRLNGSVPIIAGATILNRALLNSNVTGITLRTDPHVALARLKALVPGVRRVHVVYNPGDHTCLMERAWDAAEQLNLTLLDYRVDAPKLSAHVQTYRHLSRQFLDQHDALWLCDNLISVEEGMVLPLLLELAWRNRVVLFSENPQHARQGALFAFVPNYARLGEQLAEMAFACLVQPAKIPAIAPVAEVSLLINLRTAGRLGIAVARRAQSGHLTLLPGGMVMD